VNGAGDLIELECDLNPVFNAIPADSNDYHTMVMTQFLVADTISMSIASKIVAGPFTSKAGLGYPNIGGGIVAILARLIVMDPGSSISASGAGFSGGNSSCGIPPVCTDCPPSCSIGNYIAHDCSYAGQKGASIIPYSENPVVRGYARGAGANGGGGGNDFRAAGGGGANVCADMTKTWSGVGVIDLLSTVSFSILHLFNLLSHRPYLWDSALPLISQQKEAFQTQVEEAEADTPMAMPPLAV